MSLTKSSSTVEFNLNHGQNSNSFSNLLLQLDGEQQQRGIDSAAGQRSVSTDANSTILCRYFVLGICRFGTLCRFSHDTTQQSQPIDSSSLCESASSQVQTEIDDNNSTSDLNAISLPQNNATTTINRAIPNDLSSWINAPEFVPKWLGGAAQEKTSTAIATASEKESETEAETFDVNDADTTTNSSKSYAQIVTGKDGVLKPSSEQNVSSTEILCPYVRGTPVMGPNNELTMVCRYGAYCEYKHGCLCDMCGQFCLHPTDMEQRRRHQFECIRQHEKDMELSFAIARSKDKTCGVCFEIITEKNGGEQRFGILPNCNHIFCLQCIRKWRQAKQFDNNIIRACPECRVTSDFVCPSLYWVESKEDKDKLINDYKGALGKQDCKYFKQGSGKCPFGNKCFYKHALPDGKLVDVGVPHRQERRRQNANGETDVLQQLLLWNFLDARENIFIDDFVSLISDNSDSDLSESDMFDV